MAGTELRRIFVGYQPNLTCREHLSAGVIAEVREPCEPHGNPPVGWVYYLTLSCVECGHRWRGSLIYEPNEPLPQRFLAVQGKAPASH